jgi:hypothetical protein
MIKPEDVRARMPHTEAVKTLERKLDAAINYAALTSKWPASLALRGEPASAVNETVSMYREVGWTIECVGDFITIEAP